MARHNPLITHDVKMNCCFVHAYPCSDKYGLVYVVTKLGLLFVYDLETATAVRCWHVLASNGSRLVACTLCMAACPWLRFALLCHCAGSFAYLCSWPPCPAAQVYRTRISADPIFLAAPAPGLGGFSAVNRRAASLNWQSVLLQ